MISLQITIFINQNKPMLRVQHFIRPMQKLLEITVNEKDRRIDSAKITNLLPFSIKNGIQAQKSSLRIGAGHLHQCEGALPKGAPTKQGENFEFCLRPSRY